VETRRNIPSWFRRVLQKLLHPGQKNNIVNFAIIDHCDSSFTIVAYNMFGEEVDMTNMMFMCVESGDPLLLRPDTPVRARCSVYVRTIPWPEVGTTRHVLVTLIWHDSNKPVNKFAIPCTVVEMNRFGVLGVYFGNWIEVSNQDDLINDQDL
jgi:hypothetical protein